MTKFLTSIVFSVCVLAVVPACAKKTKKQEPMTEQVTSEATVQESVANDKENYTV